MNDDGHSRIEVQRGSEPRGASNQRSACWRRDTTEPTWDVLRTLHSGIVSSSEALPSGVGIGCSCACPLGWSLGRCRRGVRTYRNTALFFAASQPPEPVRHGARHGYVGRGAFGEPLVLRVSALGPRAWRFPARAAALYTRLRGNAPDRADALWTLAEARLSCGTTSDQGFCVVRQAIRDVGSATKPITKASRTGGLVFKASGRAPPGGLDRPCGGERTAGRYRELAGGTRVAALVGVLRGASRSFSK